MSGDHPRIAIPRRDLLRTSTHPNPLTKVIGAPPGSPRGQRRATGTLPAVQRWQRSTAHPLHQPRGGVAVTMQRPYVDQEVYLLFAHEPYFPPNGMREVNATIVAAGALLHSRVRQPDGARIHRLLHNGRRIDREIVPLATLTHELDGGAGGVQIADWEQVSADVLALTRLGSCDSFGIGLPSLARALLCSSPHSQVVDYNPETGRREVHGPEQREAVLTALSGHLRTARVGGLL